MVSTSKPIEYSDIFEHYIYFSYFSKMPGLWNFGTYRIYTNSLFKMHPQLFNGARALNFKLDLHLRPYLVRAAMALARLCR